jgi:hypothetical protein
MAIPHVAGVEDEDTGGEDEEVIKTTLNTTTANMTAAPTTTHEIRPSTKKSSKPTHHTHSWKAS